MHIPTTRISFNRDAVAYMTAEVFIDHFRSAYPDADLEAYAKSLGLISEAVAEEAPPAIPSLIDGGEAPGMAQKRKGGKK